MDERSKLREHFRFRPDHVDVEITGILTAEGKPVTVRLHRPDARELAELLRVMPGPAPATVAEGDGRQEEDVEESSEDRVARLAVPLIERWASVQLPTGEWIRPAFSFSPDGDLGDLLPGDQLTHLERARLGLTLLQLGGYAGGAAADSFLGDRGGSNGRG